MALTIRRTGAADYGQYIKMLIGGAPGSGKTVFGSTSIEPLVVDCEGGLMSIADRRVPYAEINTTLELQQLLTHLDQDEKTQKEMLGFAPETIVIDTIDEVQKMFERERMRETGKDALTMQDYGWLKDRMLDTIRSYRNLNANVIFLVHLKDSIDEESGTVSIKPGLKGAVADEIAAYMDIVGVIVSEEFKDVDGTEMVTKSRRILRTQPDHKIDWIKDRSWKLPAKIPLNGRTDFKRIHATVFKEVPEEESSEKEVPAPEEPRVDLIERVAEQAPNPISDSDSDDTKAGD